MPIRRCYADQTTLGRKHLGRRVNAARSSRGMSFPMVACYTPVVDRMVMIGLGQRTGCKWQTNGDRGLAHTWYLNSEGKESEWAGTPASKCRMEKSSRAAFVLKVWGRGDFRSWTQADYDQWTPDGNGGQKKGAWPYDAFFAGPFNPADRTIAQRVADTQVTVGWHALWQHASDLY